MNTCLAVETSVRRAPPLLGMTVILSVLLLSIGCFLPKRQGSQWPVMELASEEVQIRLERIPSGVKDAPYMGIRALTRTGSVLLLVDTGTSLSVLRESLKPELKVSRLSRQTVETEGEGETRDFYTTSSLRVGPLEFTNEAVSFLPDQEVDALTQNSGVQVDGLLGATLLKRGEIEFRGPEGEMVIRPFDRSKIKADDRSLALIFLSKSNTYAIPLQTESGQGSRLLLDTGTNVELILDAPRPLARKVMESDPVASWNYRSIHGVHQAQIFELPFSLSGPGIIFPKGRRVCIDTQRESPLDGVIGVPIFWKTPKILLNTQAELVSFSDQPS